MNHSENETCAVTAAAHKIHKRKSCISQSRIAVVVLCIIAVLVGALLAALCFVLVYRA